MKTARFLLRVFPGLILFSTLRYGTPAAWGQAAPGGAAADDSRALTLDVVVTDKSGQPVVGLEPGEFTLVDNKKPLSPVSVRAATGFGPKADPPVEAILLLDAVNSPPTTAQYVRQWLQTYLQHHDEPLTLPTTLVVLTEKGFNVQDHPTRNGKALIAFLDANPTGLRTVTNSGGAAGTEEHVQISLKGLDYLAAQAARRPGRKLLIWISPGWFMFSNHDWYAGGNKKDQQNLFNYIASLSTSLSRARMTIYSIDPLGAGHGQFRYEIFLKGVDSPGQTDYGDLALPVLATQSGGQVLAGSNDLEGLIEQCVADARAYYIVTVTPTAASHPNEYHEVKIQLDKPGLTARTRTGYYAQP